MSTTSSLAGSQRSSSSSLLKLYRQLLRALETYPSINRQSIREAVRDEWRSHRHSSDQQLVERQIAVAYKGLEQLGRFDERNMSQGGSSSNSTNWSVTLEQNPMPRPAHWDDKAKSTRK
jgi:hypothetical protein